MNKIWLIALIGIITLGMVCCSKDDDKETTIYTVTFDADGGIPIPSAQRVEAGSTVTAPAVNPAKSGYIFLFWHLSGATTAYNFQSPVNNDIMLYAKWQEETTAEYWQVTWNLNGGAWPSSDNHVTQVLKGGTLPEPAAPVKTGNTFEGWYKEAALTNKVTFPYDVSNVTANFTLYAKWTTGGGTPEEPAPTTLYIAGAITDTGIRGSCYWKVDLATGNATQTILTIYGEANDIVVSNGDIYVSGRETSTAGNAKGCYWENGEITFLNLEYKTNITTSGIGVSGSDIYLSGTDITYSATPCYWKNGVRTDLPKSERGGATGLFVADGDVYISGYDVDGKEEACYWKNNTRTTLTDGHTPAEAHDIHVSGKDVYTAGRQRNGKWYACYWKGNTQIALTNAQNDAQALGITISNGTVYTAGYESTGTSTVYTACYWENTKQVPLEQGVFARANDIAVSGKNVYVAGSTQNGNNDIACYWINGVKHTLPNGTTALSIALSWE